jgi:O-antigen/teichoic acid export membrane protein
MAKRSQRLLEAARKPVPEGTYAVGLGLLVSGLAAYGFQIIAYRALSKGDYTALNGLWVIAFVLAPGFFLPLEQEVGRALADRRARGQGGGPLIRRAAIAGGLLSAGLIVLALVLEVLLSAIFDKGLSDAFFHERRILLLCLSIALATYAVQHLTRGTLSGNGRFGPYGLILALEGLIRLTPVVILYAAGIDDLVWYGLAFAIPPGIASWIALRGQRGLAEPGPPAPWAELSKNISWLFAGSVLFQLLSYSPVIGILVLAEGKAQRELAADFIVGFFIARIPILLFQAVQAALLPKLAGLAAAGRHADFRGWIKKLLVVVVAVGAAGVLGGGLLGSTVGKILFGDEFRLDNGDLVLLATGSALFILALTLAQALIALMGHAKAACAWTIGNVAFWIVLLVSSDDLFLRGELGFVAGSAISALTMAILLREQLRSGIPDESLVHLVEQIEHEPLEI